LTLLLLDDLDYYSNIDIDDIKIFFYCVSNLFLDQVILSILPSFEISFRLHMQRFMCKTSFFPTCSQQLSKSCNWYYL